MRSSSTALSLSHFFKAWFSAGNGSQSSLELVGWRDSDGDGIFDVLDVAHTLEGTGTYDPAAGIYRFVGESSVQTLPNLNPRESALPTESLQNDITINRISRVEYRIDGGSGGAWQTAATPDTYVAALDLEVLTESQVDDQRFAYLTNGQRVVLTLWAPISGRFDLFFETLTLVRAVVANPDRESFGNRIVGIDAPIDLVAAIVGYVSVLNRAILANVAKDVGSRGRYEEHARQQHK